MKKTIKWGIIGLGKIAHKFAADLQLVNNAELYAVASRDLNKAQQFAQKYKAQKTYSSYEELAENSEVDIVYIATPHSFHYENTLMCLKKGKAVLCEKPLGINVQEEQSLIHEAKSRGLFLMEGMWTRFIPATEKLLELLENKTIGDILFVRADFGFKAEYNPESRIFNKKLGGGSLLDIGIYPLYFSLLTLGKPTEIKAMARKASTRVDSYCSVLLDYENNRKASLESTFEAQTPTEAIIYGSKGTIKLHKQFHHTEKISITLFSEEKTIEIKYKGSGYVHEIEEVNQCLLNGKTESEKYSLQDSLELMSLIDKVKKEIELEY